MSKWLFIYFCPAFAVQSRRARKVSEKQERKKRFALSRYGGSHLFQARKRNTFVLKAELLPNEKGL